MISDARERQLAPVLGLQALAVTWWACMLAGAVAVVAAVGGLDLDDIRAMGPSFWLLVVFVVVGELRPIVTSGDYDPQGVNLSTAFMFAILLHWGLGPAVAVLVIGTLLGEAAKRKPLWIMLFNPAQYALSYVAAAAVLAAMGFESSPTQPHALLASDLPAVLLAAAVYHVTNISLVALLLKAERGSRFRDELLDDGWYYLLTTFAVLALSPLVVAVIDEGWPFVFLLLPPLYAVYKTAQMSVREEHQSLHDALTGLGNRALLVRRTTEALTAGGPGVRGALLLLDLDDFKEINDTLGHQAGDGLLTLVAARLEGAVREDDLVVRLGGDEFAVLLPSVPSLTAATDVATRVGTAFERPYQLDDMLLDLRASIGVAVFPDHGTDVEQLLRCADVAMYQAKESRSVIEVYASDRDHNTASRLGLFAELRRGIEGGELELHYQPKVTLADRAVIGLEGLVRWRHPLRGLLPPDEFLPLAEHAGLVRALTDVVLETALAQVSEWRQRDLPVEVAVNVSLRDLADSGFADAIRSRLRRHGLPADALRLEVTEHVLMGDALRTASTLSALRAAGVGLSLDDFGTGYSSLAHLKRLPVTELKIDRAFVSRMSADDVAIIRSVVGLAHALGLTTVAEGVETEEVWQTLLELGCDAAQGWLVARAMPPDQATAWLEEHLGVAAGATSSLERAGA